MRSSNFRLIVLASVAVLIAAAPAARADAPARSPLWAEQCVQMTAGGKSVPDVNAQVGDGRLTAGIDPTGTITNLRYPTPGYYNQVKIFGTGADAEGHQAGQLPNEGVFAGLRITTGHGRSAQTRVAWFTVPALTAPGRAWTHRQQYVSDRAPIVRTTLANPALGLSVALTDIVSPEPLTDGRRTATLARSVVVTRAPGSPVAAADLIAYEHLGVFGSRIRYAPVADTCGQQVNEGQLGAYDAGADVITQSWHGIDAASGRPSSVAFAVGFDRRSAEHQVGDDHADPLGLPPGAGPADGYDELTAAPHALGGNGIAAGPVTGALLAPLRFDRRGRARERILIAGAGDPASAASALQAERLRGEARLARTTERVWAGELRGAQLPAVDPSDPAQARILTVARHSLLTMLLGTDPDSGAIVAASFSQSAYGEDWIRDGAFINEALDTVGLTARATRHALFEASVQTTATNPDLLRAPGNWPENVYGDGIPSGPIPYEIDETGLGAWMLDRHAEFLHGSAATDYLGRVFPAIARAADYLTACRDPRDALLCPAFEDDSSDLSQTLHGSGPAVLALRSAVAAARRLGRAGDPRVPLWQARADELTATIDRMWLPDRRVYGESFGGTDVAGRTVPGGGAVEAPSGHRLFEDGGWLVWPVELHAYDDPRMVDEARAVRAGALDSLRHADSGEYESKALLASCLALRALPPPERTAARAELRSALELIAADSTRVRRGLATDTGLLSESWGTAGSGSGQHLFPSNETPHVWAHAMFLLTSLCVFGGHA